jgi:hypothetical protein
MDDLLTTPPVLDTRTADDVYEAALAAARKALPQWAIGFGASPDYFDRADVGLVMFKLFGELFHKLATPLNGTPSKYALAFWDFMGLTLRAPKAAEAPIAFVSNVASVVDIAKGTRIIAPSAPGIVFETAEDLAVLPLSIAAAYAVRPSADAYADYSGQIGGQGEPFPMFADDPAQQPFAHALWMSDPSFDFTGEAGRLILTLEGANLYPRYFANWFNVAGKTLRPEFTVSGYDTLTLTFGELPDLPVGQVDGLDGRWIGVSPDAGVRIVSFLDGVLPQIYSVAAELRIDASAADQAFCNSQTVDLKKGGYPFGQAPALQDAFYLASQTVFSRPGAGIKLKFHVEPVDPPEPVELAWEFWNGVRWQAFEVADSTADLTRSGHVKFVCPQIIRSPVNNVDNYWIRVRIAAGGYGAKAGVLVTQSAEYVIDDVLAPYVSDKPAAIATLKGEGINFGFQYRPASYTPPFVKALQIDSVLVKRPDRMIARNGFTYAPLRSEPFLPPSETEATFFLGLAVRDFAMVADRILTLFLAPKEGQTQQFLVEASDLSLQFAYWGPRGWAPLAPIHADTGFSADGVVTMRLPEDFQASTLFGQHLYWLKIVAPPGAAAGSGELVGVFVNVAPAFNAVTQHDVILGSSTGGPSQVFSFAQKPVLEGAQVQVLEPVPATLPAETQADEDVGASLAEANAAAAASDIKQSWITWREVSNLDFSTPFSRHYVLDHESGQLMFGDGLRGMIPPEGRRNIRAAKFQSGGGVQGDLPAGVLNTLQKDNPDIQSLANVLPAVGGVAADKLQDLQVRGPGQIRALDRAVTAADYAALALASSQDVAQAVCLDDDLEKIRVVVLPNEAGQTPAPGFDLTSTVETYVRQRALPLVRPLIVVDGPDYALVDARFSVLTAAGASTHTIIEAISQGYAAFLNPLSGGLDGQGWSFGARIDAALAADMAQAVPGVAFVDGVTLGADLSAVQMGPDQLPSPGQVIVEFVDADAL